MGSKYYTTTVRTETLTYELDEAKLAAPVAAAIRDAVADGIRGITEMSHDGKHRLFNRTGALVAGLTVVQSGGAFCIVPPSDHFQEPTGPALLERLVELVPVIQDPTKAAGVVAAIEKSAGVLVKAGPVKVETY
jgi:hypothetical protein